MESHAAPLRAEAAKRLGEQLAGDEETVLALSIATNDESEVVRQASRRALVRIFDARYPGRGDEEVQLEDAGRVAREGAHRLGQGAITVIQWLWNSFYFWPGLDGFEA